VDRDARDRWSNVAHANRRLCSPVDEARLAAFLKELPVPPAPYTVDLGCGKAEALRRVVELHGGSGTGVDISARMLGDAFDGEWDIEFAQADAAMWRPERRPDVALCIGSAHIFGGAAGAAAALGALVAPGGIVVLGDGYWRAMPTAAELASFGMEPDELGDLTELVALVRRADLVPIAVQPSTDAEWDGYEWSLIRAVEVWAAANPDDPDGAEFLSRTRFMRDTYLEWRRAAFGFALVAALKPKA
jgi:SAM-dependent methyltransferase